MTVNMTFECNLKLYKRLIYIIACKLEQNSLEKSEICKEIYIYLLLCHSRIHVNIV